MSNRVKRKERKRNKVKRPQKGNQEKTVKSPWQWLGMLSPTGKFAAAIALFLTIVGAYYSFTPKISISYSSPITQKDLRSTPFVVRNNSLLPVKNIRFKWYSRKTVTEKNITIKNITFTSSDIPPVPHLEPGEASTFILPFLFRDEPMRYADIDISVTYQPALLPFEKEKTYRFTGQITEYGVQWFERALSEK